MPENSRGNRDAAAKDPAGRLTVVWIGGAEHPGVDAPPGAPAAEYHTAIDPSPLR